MCVSFCLILWSYEGRLNFFKILFVKLFLPGVIDLVIQFFPQVCSVSFLACLFPLHIAILFTAS